MNNPRQHPTMPFETSKYYTPASLPNSEGFRFIGVDFEGRKHHCEVIKIDGAHLVNGMVFNEMVYWYC